MLLAINLPSGTTVVKMQSSARWMGGHEFRIQKRVWILALSEVLDAVPRILAIDRVSVVAEI